MVDKGVTTKQRESEPTVVKSSNDVDVRFFKSIVNLKERLKSSYFSCNQRRCPVIEERLNHHNCLRHSAASPSEHNQEPQTNIISSCPMTSSQVSKHYATSGTEPEKKARYFEKLNNRATNKNTGNYKDVQTTYKDDVTTGTGPDTNSRHTSNNGRFEQHNTKALNINTGNYDDVQTTYEDNVTTGNEPDTNATNTINNSRFHQQITKAYNINTGKYDDEKETDKKDVTTDTRPETNSRQTSNNASFEQHNSRISYKNTGQYDEIQTTYKDDMNIEIISNTDSRNTFNNGGFEQQNTRFLKKKAGNYDDDQTTYRDDVTKTRPDTNGRNTKNKGRFEQLNTRASKKNTGNYGDKQATCKHDDPDNFDNQSRKYIYNNNSCKVQQKKRNESGTNTTGLRNITIKAINYDDRFTTTHDYDESLPNTNARNYSSNRDIKRDTSKANMKSNPFEYKNYVDACSNYDYGKVSYTQYNFNGRPITSAEFKSIKNDNYGTIPLTYKIDSTTSNTPLVLNTFDKKYNTNTKYGTRIANTFDRSSKSETSLNAISKLSVNSIAPQIHKIQEITKPRTNTKEEPFQTEVIECPKELPMFLSLAKEAKEDEVTVTTELMINSTTPQLYKFQEITESRSDRNEEIFQKEVEKWIQCLPMFPRLKQNDNANTMNNLINNLKSFASEDDDLEFEIKAKKEINKFLKRLPIWYPGEKRNQDVFKSSLIDRLIEKIRTKNSKIIDEISGATNSHRKVITTIDTHKAAQHHTNSNSKDIKSKVSNDEIKNVVMEWLIHIIKTRNCNGITNNMPQIADIIIDRLGPLLSNPVRTKNRKLVLKNTILKILGELPIDIKCPKNRTIEIFAEDLANSLFSIQVKYVKRSNNTNISTALTHGYTTFNYAQNEFIICCEVRKCFKDANINCTNELMEDASLILMEFIKMSDPKGEMEARHAIIHLLVTFVNLSETQASIIANTVIRKIKNMIDEHKINSELQSTESRQRNAFSVYSSAEEFSSLNYPLTSTPKKIPAKKTIAKLNPQEIQYMENVGNVIRVWMDTLPENFSSQEEQNFKETMIRDLAGDIMDKVKLEQLVPQANLEFRKNRLYHILYRWIQKLNVINVNEVQPQVVDFLNRLEHIPVPILTQPQHGNRQAMENIKFIRDDKRRREDSFLPKASDILQDGISIWMNEQPSYIFAESDKISRNKKIQELAQVLKKKLENKRPQTEILADVTQWLLSMVKLEGKGEISELSENLKDRVINLPQDFTLIAKYDQKKKEFEECKGECKNPKKNPPTNMNEINRTDSVDQEHTMQIFISKYLEHKYDIDDPLARRAFNRLLVTYLQGLDASKRKEVYDNFGKSENDYRFVPKKIISELEYIKDISDWLKNIPVEGPFNTPGNLKRIDLVNSLAISIREVEEERYNNPSAMDYDVCLGSIIFDFMQQLPIPKENYQCGNIGFMVCQLVNKIIANRQTVINLISVNESLNTTGVNADNIGDFLEEFIQINGEDIAQDEAKLDAWAVRLTREVIQIIRDTECVIPKAQVYNELIGVPIPGDETVNYFNLELKYVTEITNWLKNLPLLQISESEKEDRVRMICELAEKMIEMERKSVNNPNGTRNNIGFKEYVAKWISDLPLDKKHEIVLPVVIQQLMNRMERVKKQKEVLPELDFSQSKNTVKSTSNKDRNKNVSKCQRKNVQNASSLIIHEIEKWSKALPIKTNSEKTAANIQNDISRNLSQKVGELNMNSKVFNNDLVYHSMLADEVYTILENMPQTINLRKKDKLKTNIVNAIMEARNDIKENTAADTYKLNLENTIEASIPNPVNKKLVYDPGFEIYKHRLATIFILENFDHGTDIVKVKYEKLLKKEIDNYFDHAKIKNAVPISKDEIYNQLYSDLFKVSIPNEASIVEEIEEIKTRCEIDAWFEELPVQEANGLNELLEWDKILTTLAKRIHEIETSKMKSDENILKEIMKCLAKLPLRLEYKNKLDKFAENLLKTLKSTELQRKCVTDIKTSTYKKCKRCEKTKVKESDYKHIEDSQVAGPSTNGKMWTSLFQPQQMREHRNPRYKACDEIVKIVQNWCGQIPVKCTNLREQEYAQVLKDNLATQIIIKIGELNMNPAIFNADSLYDDMLDEELDTLLAILPTCYSFGISKDAIKQQLIEAIKAVKPLIIEERSNQRYKEVLNETVDKILKITRNISAGKEAHFNEIRNDIIDDFILYKYGTDDDEVRLGHKINIKNTIIRFYDIVSNKDDNNNPLMKTNQLICELAKIPNYEANVRDEVEEIRMKREVAIFFDELYLPGKCADSKVHNLKAVLAKKLNEIEMNGHTPQSEDKMKQEVIKCLNKLEKEVDPPLVDAFINKLQNNEIIRRTIVRREEDGGHIIEPQIRSIPFQDHDDIEDELLEDSGDEYEDQEEEEIDERVCPFYRSFRRRRGIPYCMIPMKYRCKSCMEFSIFLCRMPFSG